MSKSRKKYDQIFSQDQPREHERDYCRGKQCLSQVEANAMINSIKRRQHTAHSKVIPKRSYRCPYCGCWHLTSKPQYDDPREFY